MNAHSTDPADLARHLKRMKVLVTAFLALQPATLLLLFFVRGHFANALLSPMHVTLLLAAAALWIAFTAERDAEKRLAHAKHGFTVHGNEARLLREHVLVYLLVLLRLEAISVCGVLAALWGKGFGVAIWFVVLAALLTALTWPTPRKAKLLIERAQAAKRDISG
jgi:hypothetical protein